MKSKSGLGLGLCVVFGCLLLALIAELYYLLWWKKKKRIITTTTSTKIDDEEEQNGIQIPQKRSNFSHILHLCKTPSSSLRSTAQELCNSPTDLVHEPQTQSSNSSNKDPWLRKPFVEENMGDFPRFLFTITEETREDLESEDGVFKNRKHSTSRSNLSDLLQILETPFLTPLASPPYFTPPLTPSFCDHHDHHYQQSLEWERDAEFNRARASPPPMFKFLRDAEEKLVQRGRIMVVGDDHHLDLDHDHDHENGQFITLVIDEKQDGICNKSCCSSDFEENEECFSS